MRTFGSTPIPAEIDGNTYHLPDSLTPGQRIKVHKQITAFSKAADAEVMASRRLQAAGKTADDAGTGALDEAFIAAEAEFKEASAKVADPARALLIALLQPVVKDQPIPGDIGDHIADRAAIEYADTLVSGGRVEPDPT